MSQGWLKHFSFGKAKFSVAICIYAEAVEQLIFPCINTEKF